MRKNNYLSLLFVSLLPLSLASCGDDDGFMPLPPDELPYEAQSFISYFYDDMRIKDIDIDHDHHSVEYEVKMANGDKITFDGDGNWISVEAPSGRAIPGGIAPDFIYYQIDYHFPGEDINEISKEYYGYDVELTNEVEMEFDWNGEILSIDD